MAKLIILSVKNLHYFWQSWLFIEDFIRELIVCSQVEYLWNSHYPSEIWLFVRTQFSLCELSFRSRQMSASFGVSLEDEGWILISREFTLYENEECRSHSGGTVVPDECYGAGGQGLPPLLHAGDVQGLWGEEEHQILNLLIYPIFYEELLTEL